jgi:hypothetical protein
VTAAAKEKNLTGELHTVDKNVNNEIQSDRWQSITLVLIR